MNNVNSLNSLILQNDQAIQWPEISDDNLIKYFERNSVLCTAKNSNAKISKSNGSTVYRTAYLPLLPADYSGFNVCPFHFFCKDSCIGHNSGQNTLASSILSKYYKTLYFHRFREEFLNQLFHEVENFDRLCRRNDMQACIRLNAYSDIRYEKIFPELFNHFLDVQFYDYTKIHKRLESILPSNYHLTYSLVAAENPPVSAYQIHCRTYSAVVSRDVYDSIDWSIDINGNHFKITRLGQNTLYLMDGEENDLTFLRPSGIILLREKYKKKPENDNPLVYRDKEVFGL